MSFDESEVYKLSSLFNSTLARKGLLVSSVGSEGRANVMTIGWGKIGVLWGKPFFLAFIRRSRYTYSLIEQTGDFTVNVPPKGFEKVVNYCGTKTGREVDKIRELGLKLKPSRKVKSPTLADCLATIECKVVFKKNIQPKDVPPDFRRRFYPRGDYHVCYFAEVVNATSNGSAEA
jgi:flavin reductase (DIM6/NTAB) family NADH-FMN oxidoreductase RutF